MTTRNPASKPTRRRSTPTAKAKTPRNIWLELASIGSSVPKARRAALPRDGARNLDDYLDGPPKAD